jgi:hypothetical protein
MWESTHGSGFGLLLPLFFLDTERDPKYANSLLLTVDAQNTSRIISLSDPLFGDQTHDCVISSFSVL